MTTITPAQAHRMRRAADRIEAEPDHFDIETWMSRGWPDGTEPNTDPMSVCETTACIAGWAIVLEHPEKFDTFSKWTLCNMGVVAMLAWGTEISAYASCLLGLPESFFFPEFWPNKLGIDPVADKDLVVAALRRWADNREIPDIPHNPDLDSSRYVT